MLDVLFASRKYDEVVKMAKEGLTKAQATNHVLFHIKLATAYAMLGKNDQALASADDAVKVTDDRNRLHVCRMRINVLIQAERFDQAAKDCLALLKEYKRADEVRDIRYTLSGVYSQARSTQVGGATAADPGRGPE